MASMYWWVDVLQKHIYLQFIIHSTQPIMKKKAEIFLHYRQLFIKGDVIIGEWAIFGVEIFLHYSRFFIKGDLVIDIVECTKLKPTTPTVNLPF